MFGFEKALGYLKEGKKVRRALWAKRVWLEINPEADHRFIVRYPNSMTSLWICNFQTDLLAED